VPEPSSGNVCSVHRLSDPSLFSKSLRATSDCQKYRKLLSIQNTANIRNSIQSLILQYALLNINFEKRNDSTIYVNINGNTKLHFNSQAFNKRSAVYCTKDK
jgi:hypothetical protein